MARFECMLNKTNVDKAVSWDWYTGLNTQHMLVAVHQIPS